MLNYGADLTFNHHFETAMILAGVPELLVITDEEGRKPVPYAARYGNATILEACTNS